MPTLPLPSICRVLLLFFITLGLAACGETQKEDSFKLQVLGSGGHDDNAGRASSGHLVWVDGAPRVMIDIGPGTVLRFGESGAEPKDLDLLAVTHLHVDHVNDISAMAKRGFFWGRDEKLPVRGPSANTNLPGINDFLTELIYNERSAPYRYLSLDADDDNYIVYEYGPDTDSEIHVPLDLDALAAAEPVMTFESEEHDYQVWALPVQHAHIPSLAYRVDRYDNDGSLRYRIVVTSDQNLRDPSKPECADCMNLAYVNFIQDADIVVQHFPIEERGYEHPGQTLWHAQPSMIGKVADMANVKMLVLSHLMQGALKELNESVEEIRNAGYTGKIEVAEDLKVYKAKASSE